MAGAGKVILDSVGVKISGSQTAEQTYNRLSWFDASGLIAKVAAGLFYDAQYPDLVLESNPDLRAF